MAAPTPPAPACCFASLLLRLRTSFGKPGKRAASEHAVPPHHRLGAAAAASASCSHWKLWRQCTCLRTPRSGAAREPCFSGHPPALCFHAGERLFPPITCLLGMFSRPCAAPAARAEHATILMLLTSNVPSRAGDCQQVGTTLGKRRLARHHSRHVHCLVRAHPVGAGPRRLVFLQHGQATLCTSTVPSLAGMGVVICSLAARDRGTWQACFDVRHGSIRMPCNGAPQSQSHRCVHGAPPRPRGAQQRRADCVMVCAPPDESGGRVG